MTPTFLYPLPPLRTITNRENFILKNPTPASALIFGPSGLRLWRLVPPSTTIPPNTGGGLEYTLHTILDIDIQHDIAAPSL